MREKTKAMREQPPPVSRASSMTGLGASFALRPEWGGWAKALGSAVVMGVFLSLMGAFETGELPLMRRLFYWVPLMVMGTATAVGIDALASRILKPFWHLERKPWQYCALLVALLTPTISLIVWAYTPEFGGQSRTLEAYVAVLLPVAIISTAMTALTMLLNRDPLQSHAFVGDDAPLTAPRAVAFLERLPFKYQHADIYALSAEDHYLRVHTSAGQTLILMRLYDAIRELEGIEGSQTHRSWWVAKSAIEATQRQDGRVCLILKGGAIAPVSRSFQKALKSDGWI